MSEIRNITPFPSEGYGSSFNLALSPTSAFTFATGVQDHCWEVSAPSYLGTDTGLDNNNRRNRLLVSGEWLGGFACVAIVKITGNGDPDPVEQNGTGVFGTFQFSFDGGGTWSDDQRIYEGKCYLDYGLYATFFERGFYGVGSYWTFNIDRSTFVDDGNWRKWSTCVGDHGIYFVNEVNQCKWIQNKTVYNLQISCTLGAPAGRYVAHWYGRLCIACPVFFGAFANYKIAFSDMHDYYDFDIRSDNEATLYEFNVPTDVGEYSNGVQGMMKLGEGLVVYFPREIWMLTYAGLPLVLQRRRVVDGIGNCFPWAVTGTESVHFFISDENIYVFDGNTPLPIGDAIKEYFFSNLSTNPDYRYKVWGTVQRYFNEVRWQFVSNGSEDGSFDRQIVFNWRDKIWYIEESNNLTAHATIIAQEGYKTCADHSEGADTDEQQCNLIDPITGVSKVDLWGTSDYKLVRDAISSDSAAGYLAQALPFVETHDEYYGNFRQEKTVDGLDLQADYDETQCAGIDIYYSHRRQLDEPIEWLLCGTWTKDLVYGHFSFPRKKDRIFRFKFVAKPLPDTTTVGYVKISGWCERVSGLPELESDK